MIIYKELDNKLVEKFENNERGMIKRKRENELENKEEIEGEDVVMSEFLEHVIDAEHLLEKIILFILPLPFHEE